MRDWRDSVLDPSWVLMRPAADDLRHTHTREEMIRTATTTPMVAPAITPVLAPWLTLLLAAEVVADELAVVLPVVLVVLEVLVFVVSRALLKSEATFAFVKSLEGRVSCAKPLELFIN